jgi:Arc/MetJ-type ribon-helix-helix transcriptional regulator
MELWRLKSGLVAVSLGDHAKAAIDDQVKSGHREKA